MNLLDYFNKNTSQKIWTIGQLQHMFSSLKKGMSDSTLYRQINKMESLGILEKLRGGLYINKIHPLGASYDMLPQYIRSDAIVSLKRVLGDHGVLNNGTQIITCVLPIGKNETHKYNISNYNYEPKNEIRKIIFYGIPAKYYYCQNLPRNLIVDDKKPYPCATVEKAFCDHLYLGNSIKSNLLFPPYDCNISIMNMKKLKIIVKEMNIINVFEKWLENKNKYDNDENVQENMSIKFKI